MRQKPKSKVHTLELNYPNGLSRTVRVKASTREVAEKRALKRNPGSLSVKNAS